MENSPAEACKELILAGNAPETIHKALANLYPNKDPKKVMAEARRLFERAGAQTDSALRGFALEACREIYRRGLGAGDFQVALGAIKQLMAVAKTPRPHTGGEDEPLQIEI